MELLDLTLWDWVYGIVLLIALVGLPVLFIYSWASIFPSTKETNEFLREQEDRHEERLRQLDEED